MESIIKRITNDVIGLAVWSSDWNSYINCYLVKNERGFCLIDTLSREQREELIGLFTSADFDKSSINTVIATHGHKDHTGNINLFENAEKYIHKNDITINEENETGCYEVLEGEKGRLFEFEWMLLGKHTPGSIVLYHEKTKTLFGGDYICFFGFPIPEDGLISEAPKARALWFEFISSGEFSGAMRAQNMNPLDIARDIQRMAVYDAEYFCTGHGVILKHNIPEFLNKLSDEIIKYEGSRQS